MYKFIFVLIIVLFTVLEANGTESVTIALSKGSGGDSYQNYSEWLKYHNENVIIIDLISSDNPIADLEKCDAILFTGGPDVHPGRFDKEDEEERCSIDLERDTLEFEAFKYAKENRVPIMGICRGHQLINVAMGGSLYTDIPTDYPEHSQHQVDEGDARHEVKIDTTSYLYKITGIYIQEVNSNHHQGVEKLGKNLKSTAISPDGLNEAFEWENPENLSWMVAVGWHPERLDRDDKLSKPLALEFIKSALAYKKERATK